MQNALDRSRKKVRILFQSEAAECGLACLGMIASYYGQCWTLSELRREISISLKGASLKGLIAHASQLGLQARPLRLDLHDLRRLKLPCILHWDLAHFVVLVRATSNWIEIEDPAFGSRRLSLDETSKHFSGVALELSPAGLFSKRVATPRVRISDLWTSSTGLITGLSEIIALAILLQVFSLLTPLISQFVIDDVVTKGDRDLLGLVLIAGALLLLMQTATSAVRSYAMLHLTTMLTFHMRGNLLRHVLSLPISWFEKRRLGDILSRFNSLTPVQDLLASGAISLTVDGMMAIITIVVMFAYAPPLAGIVLASLTCFMLVRLIAFPILRRISAEAIQVQAKVDSVLLETIRGARAFRLLPARAKGMPYGRTPMHKA